MDVASNIQKEETENLHIRRYNKNYFMLNNGEEHHGSIALLNQSVYTDCVPSTFAELTEEHFKMWIALKPRVILISCGDEMQFLDPKWQAFFYQNRIGVDVMPTESLCRTFTILAVEDREALGIFFPLQKEIIYSESETHDPNFF